MPQPTNTTRILIPTALRAYAGGSDSIEALGATVDSALADLTKRFPDLRRHLYSEDGKLRSFVNVYLNDEDVRYLPSKGASPLKTGDVLSIIPSIAGGAPEAAGASPALSNEEILRYSRHLIMPEVGMEGQRKLKAASVLCVGAGGLGSPLALYLAAAGIGRIGIVDFDVVDASNLQRQILHSTDAIGTKKLDSARERLRQVNPNVEVKTYETRLTSENALEICGGYDVVADGTDNFPTRYLVNDACVLLGKPNVYGSIFRFDGQASVFWAEKGPCYRCLYAEPPPPGLVPSCAEGGVLGILPGVIGVIQATEAVKLVLGRGEPLVGRLLLYDALRMSFRELKLRKNPDCAICGANPTITRLVDYEAFCGVGAGAEHDGAAAGREITVRELKDMMDRKARFVLVDVREEHEFAIARIPGSRLIPLGKVLERASELSTADDIVLHCKSGGRSMKALEKLEGAGFKKLKNLRGGILAWADEIDPSVPKY